MLELTEGLKLTLNMKVKQKQKYINIGFKIHFKE